MNAQDIIEALETQGFTVKDIVQLSGISQPTISMIKNGQRSGKTSLPALQQLLNASNTIQPSYAPSNNAMIPAPSRVIESTIAAIDNTPVPQKAVQPFYSTPVPQPTPVQSHNIDRGIAYRQTRNRYGVTPDEMMDEIQGLRFQLNEMSHQFKQQQKQGIAQAHKKKDTDDTGISVALLLAEIASTFVTPVLRERIYNQQNTMIPDNTRQIASPMQYQETPSYYAAPIQPRAYRRHGMYGIPISRQSQQEEKSTNWQRFKKWLNG